MVFTYDYNSTYIPSMPTVGIYIGRSGNRPTQELQALVDSGADATIVPLSILRQIGARRGDKVWMRGITRGRDMVHLYHISIQLADFQQNVLKVVGDPEYDEVILGHDILNHLVVTLNGLASVVEISS